jgi:hypothetical protein
MTRRSNLLFSFRFRPFSVSGYVPAFLIRGQEKKNFRRKGVARAPKEIEIVATSTKWQRSGRIKIRKANLIAIEARIGGKSKSCRKTRAIN